MPTGKGTMKGSKFLPDGGGGLCKPIGGGKSPGPGIARTSIPGRGIFSGLSLTLGGS
jgi:hypothetical protein